MGSRAMAVGNAAACLSDEWSLINNPAGLAEIKNLSAAVAFYTIPSFKPFNRIAATASLPVIVGVAGAGFFKYGDDLYNEQLISIGYANKFGIASLGLKGNYVQYRLEGFGSAQAFTISFGGIASITPKLMIGAVIENINQPKLSSNSDERLPTRFKVGVGSKLSEKVLALVEVEKDFENSPLAKAGLEYALHKKVFARTGFNLNPRSGFGGLGFILRKFKLDYAFQFSEYLGAAHQATVIAVLTKKK